MKSRKIRQKSFTLELIRNFSKKKKIIPSKFHYDLKGSKYFEKITKTKEYYVTRGEKEILNKIRLRRKGLEVVRRRRKCHLKRNKRSFNRDDFSTWNKKTKKICKNEQTYAKQRRVSSSPRNEKQPMV